ncbi:hypothetical protein [Hymenobacter nivis]|uniref:hypothetical protein n=1 Tax=Hymenobacter nivis TaxID=1850093 RepID=UPI00112D9735|nr:hypothetical protein [Hymenobacter nivis]
MLEAPLTSQQGEKRSVRGIVDLIILDVDFNNYLAIVEFKYKNNKTILSGAEEQVKSYLNLIDIEGLPAYLVTVDENKDLEIYILIDEGWKKIKAADFPDYTTLQSKSQADIKNVSNISEKKIYKNRRELTINIAQSALISLGLGISFIAIVYNFNLKSIFIEPENKYQAEINLLKKEIKDLQFLDTKSRSIDSVLTKPNQKISDIDNRLVSIEKIITNSPDKLLKIQEINFQFKELASSIAKEKEISEIKLNSLKERIDQVIIWTSGLIITIIGSIAGFAINAFKKN